MTLLNVYIWDILHKGPTGCLPGFNFDELIGVCSTPDEKQFRIDQIEISHVGILSSGLLLAIACDTYLRLFRPWLFDREVAKKQQGQRHLFLLSMLP